MYPLSRTPKIKFRFQWDLSDVLLFLGLIALIFVIVRTASRFTEAYNPQLDIQTTLAVLPSYTAQTLLRMLGAYGLSLGFSLVYAYFAYRSRRAAQILVPLLDILQSIPVLSFLPGVVLALIALFPGQRIGVELAAIILIFTGMAWNMTFSFYQSLTSIPRELLEAAQVYRLNAWQQFWTLELPAGAIGLVWNSVMSVAGGWFFLIQIESFTLGSQSFQLPGLGSFLAKAADRGDMGAIGWGLAVLIGVIIAIDFFIWRPLIAWAEKFKYEMVESQDPPQSTILDALRRSPTLRLISDRVWQPAMQRLDRSLNQVFTPPRQPKAPTKLANQGWLLQWIVLPGFALIAGWGTWEAILLLHVLGWSDWQQVITGAALTTLRVLISLGLSLLWTVPVGVAIGRNPKLATVLQPIVQIAASVPATALFPVMLIALVHLGGGLEIAAIALMMLGTMWYILFNVIAGAQSIPAELFEAASVYRLPLIQRWRTLILPGIFPYLVTGVITAVGGAWNASIVAEYVKLQGQTLITHGLGATISQASAAENFPLLLVSTAVMSAVVVLTNRLVWRRLYRLAEEKYRLLL